MLDTGSDVTSLSADIVYGLPLCLSTTELHAVNGTKIPTLGDAKLCQLGYKCLHRSTPCVPVLNDTSRKRLRSTLHGYLTCPRTKLVRYGDQSFGGPKIRSGINSLSTYGIPL